MGKKKVPLKISSKLNTTLDFKKKKKEKKLGRKKTSPELLTKRLFVVA